MTTAAIAEAMRDIIGDGGYQPSDSQTAYAGQLPQTLRQLLAVEDFDPYGTPDGSFSPHTGHLDGACEVLTASAKPVSLKSLDRRRPRPPKAICNSSLVLYWAFFCQGAYAWLTENGHTVDLDDPLTGDPNDWPVVDMFSDILKTESGGITLYDLFGDVEYEPYFQVAYLPLYNIEDDISDHVPLLHFLENMNGDKLYDFKMPEIFYQVCEEDDWSPVQITTAVTAMENIVTMKKFALLDEPWQTALKVMRDFPYPYICINCYDEARFELEPTEDSFDALMTCCRYVGAMRDAVDPLMVLCDSAPERFWSQLGVQLLQINDCHPQMQLGMKRQKKRVRV